MITTVERPQMLGKPNRSLYPAGMVKRLMMSVQELRSRIGQLHQAMTRGEHLMLSYRGKVFAVITPIKWYRQAAEKMDDPTEF